MWFRVFATTNEAPTAEAAGHRLQALFPGASVSFRTDDQGWFKVSIARPGQGSLELDRFLASEEGIRAELNSWVAWLETREHDPCFTRLMEHVIATKQVFTIEMDAELPQIQESAVALGRFLAQQTAGIYQVDGQGFFDMDGRLLLRED
ncbi:MAG: hypothetical protein ACJ8FY_15625 [Gemmataceae bacterium]